MAIEIITIGTELLLGDILDTNARAIALALRESGLDLHWISTVGDNPSRIAQSLRQATSRAEGVITTGGLGPTVDDPTREAAAEAFGLPLEFRPELWEAISARMSRWGRTPTENNRRQAFLPRGALPIENPVGTAPGFIVETSSSAVLSLPGVPREMEHMLKATVIPYLREKLGAPSLIRSTVLHLVGLGESQIDERVGDLERLSNPTVGLAAHSGIIDVRITAKGDHPDQVQSALTRIASEVRRRLPEAVFGQDDETLEEDILARLALRALRLATVEWGTGGKLSGRLGATSGSRSYSAGLTLPGSAADLAEVKAPHRIGDASAKPVDPGPLGPARYTRFRSSHRDCEPGGGSGDLAHLQWTARECRTMGSQRGSVPRVETDPLGRNCFPKIRLI